MKQLLALLILATTVTLAQPRWMDEDDNDGMMMPEGRKELMRKLDLTEKQEDQIKQYRSDFQKKNIELKSKVQTMRITLRDLFDEDEPSQSKIESQMSDISKMQNEMKLNATGFWFSVNKLLTPEQQKIWKKHFKEMKQQRGMGMGFKRDGGKGMMRHGMGYGNHNNGFGGRGWRR